MEKKLCRSSKDRLLGGVCAGLADYFDLDVTIVRIAYALLTFFTAFSGVIVYVILLLLMPEKK
ncbi:PspC domain-containing protein [Prevotella sp. E9-3]|uniref:PspC domain-containing protein n=1 Tax=Prevotella sp. E9-3 TaxID=2913621 RepID=UPI001EDC2DC4|nr:PspC domain-containing protein [Prevotella sp. E9-3]UKK47691.1 PspC domain-containing protein [Prevotella sp. E9-3]